MKIRSDLLALLPDDLAALSSVGIVKRAQRELKTGPTAEITVTPEGGVKVSWPSEGVECIIPEGKPLAAGTCSCDSSSLCRHLVSAALVYQEKFRTEEERKPAAPWDPGAVSEKDLEALFTKKALGQARKLWEEGQLFELTRSAKPIARCRTLSFCLRFLVPGDPRYTRCTCAGPTPCLHVALSVWAFRLLPEGSQAGLVSTGPAALPAPVSLLDALEKAVFELAEFGLAGMAEAEVHRLRRLEGECLEKGLVWPADILRELTLLHNSYKKQDARFSPARLALLVGELCIRLEALRSNNGALPPLYIRGARSYSAASAGGSVRLTGLGCRAEPFSGGVRLNAFLQDADNGEIVTISREWPDTEDESASYGKLGARPVVKENSLAEIGSGQLLCRGGNRLPNGEIELGRASLNLIPQQFRWELLRAPVLSDGFAEASARLSALPPAPLRPRRAGETFLVCPVAGVEAARFDTSEQAVTALLHDSEGGRAALLHPYTSRGAEGTDLLLEALRSGEVRFVAGEARFAGTELCFSPTLLVCERGGVRRGVLPWIGHKAGWSADETAGPLLDKETSARDPIALWWEKTVNETGLLLLDGLQRAEAGAALRWKQRAEAGAALGFTSLLDPAAWLASELEARRHSAAWNPASAIKALTELAVTLALFQQ